MSRALQAHLQRMNEVAVPLKRFTEGVSFSLRIVVDGRDYKVGALVHALHRTTDTFADRRPGGGGASGGIL